MLLPLLLFVSAAAASPLLGTEQCARGPTYWCQNVKTASLCGAVTHCQQDVWNKPQMKSVPCDLCKEVLTVVAQLLKDNATQSQILEYLEEVCQLLPDEALTAECKEMVDSYYPIIIAIITGELEDPAVACGAMGLCSSRQAALADEALPVEAAAKEAQQLLSNDIPAVDLSQVFPFIKNVPLLLYPQEKQDAPKQEAPKQGDVCQDCVKFLTDAQAEAKANSSFVDSLIEKIENECDKLGPGMSDLCRQYISQYAPLIVQQLISMEQEPKDLCSQAGFCAAVKKSSPMMKLLPANTAPAARTFPALKLFPAKRVDSGPAKTLVRARDSPQCAICEFVMKEVEDMLQDQTTEEEVIHAVEKVCTLLPSSLKAQCRDLIEAYGQAIIELLVQQADPKTVCLVLGLCKDASRAYIPLLDQSEFKSGDYCDVCLMIVRYVDGILSQNATESQIVDALRKVCNFLPEAVQTQCDMLIEEYGSIMVQLLMQMMDPDFVCMQLGACIDAAHKPLGTEQCSRGPEFWCKNMETASRCDAVTHCKLHVWPQ